MRRGQLCHGRKYATPNLGSGQNHKTLLAVFWQHNEDYAKMVGKMKSEPGWTPFMPTPSTNG